MKNDDKKLKEKDNDSNHSFNLENELDLIYKNISKTNEEKIEFEIADNKKWDVDEKDKINDFDDVKNILFGQISSSSSINDKESKHSSNNSLLIKTNLKLKKYEEEKEAENFNFKINVIDLEEDEEGNVNLNKMQKEEMLADSRVNKNLLSLNALKTGGKGLSYTRNNTLNYTINNRAEQGHSPTFSNRSNQSIQSNQYNTANYQSFNSSGSFNSYGTLMSQNKFSKNLNNSGISNQMNFDNQYNHNNQFIPQNIPYNNFPLSNQNSERFIDTNVLQYPSSNSQRNQNSINNSNSNLYNSGNKLSSGSGIISYKSSGDNVVCNEQSTKLESNYNTRGSKKNSLSIGYRANNTTSSPNKNKSTFSSSNKLGEVNTIINPQQQLNFMQGGVGGGQVLYSMYPHQQQNQGQGLINYQQSIPNIQGMQNMQQINNMEMISNMNPYNLNQVNPQFNQMGVNYGMVNPMMQQQQGFPNMNMNNQNFYNQQNPNFSTNLKVNNMNIMNMKQQFIQPNQSNINQFGNIPDEPYSYGKVQYSSNQEESTIAYRSSDGGKNSKNIEKLEENLKKYKTEEKKDPRIQIYLKTILMADSKLLSQNLVNEKESRILIKHLSYFKQDEIKTIISKIIKIADKLITNKNGSIFIQEIIPFFSIRQLIEFLKGIKSKLVFYCTNTFANRAIQTIIQYSKRNQDILEILIKSFKSNFMGLASNKVGVYVLIEILNSYSLEENNELRIFILKNISKLICHSDCLLLIKKYVDLIKVKKSYLKEELIEKLIADFSIIIKNKFGHYGLIHIVEAFGIKECKTFFPLLLKDIENYAVKSYSYKLIKKLLNLEEENEVSQRFNYFFHFLIT